MPVILRDCLELADGCSAAMVRGLLRFTPFAPHHDTAEPRRMNYHIATHTNTHMIAITKESAPEGSEKKEQTPEQYFEEWLNVATDEQLVDLVRNPNAELPVEGIKRANAIGMATVMISNRQVMQLYQAIAQQQQMMMQPAQPAYGAGMYPPAAYGAMPGAQAMYGNPMRGGVDPAVMQGQPGVNPSLTQTGYPSVPGVPPDFNPSSN